MKPILCLDFDGVIHSYSTPWVDATTIPDPPVEGAMRALWDYLDHFEVHIFSSRSHQRGGLRAMRHWLEQHFRAHWAADRTQAEDKLAAIVWPDHKPSAKVTLDDRALTFTGVWPTAEALLAFKPWNR